MSTRLRDDVRAEALFVTCLQRSDQPSTAQVRAAVGQALRRHGGGRNCAALVAAEFGDHPETAVMRMRWALDVVHEAYPEAGDPVRSAQPATDHTRGDRDATAHGGVGRRLARQGDLDRSTGSGAA